VHHGVERVERAAEERDADLLQRLDGRAEEEDCRRAHGGRATCRRALEANARQQAE
jgi:hypothetical protein